MTRWLLAAGRTALPGTLAFRLFGTLLLLQLGYRGLLLVHLLHDPVTPYSFVPNRVTLAAFARCVATDVVALALVALAVGMATRGIAALGRGAAPRWLALAGGAAFVACVLLSGVINAVHLRTMVAMHQGLDLGLIREAFGAGSSRDLLAYGEASDFALLALPLPLLLVFWPRWPVRFVQRRDRAVLIAAGLCLLLYLPLSLVARRSNRGTKLKPALREVPALYLARDAFAQLVTSADAYERIAAKLPLLPARGLFFDGPLPPPAATPSRATERAWNVLLVIMESTGARYVFDDQRAGQVPMPVLQNLAAHGLQLSRHYASANTSPRAIFSIFTGLYPEPMRDMFCTRPDIHIPGLGSLLGARYDRFFVTPGRLKSYLPLAMLEHQGITEIHGYDELPTARTTRMPGAGRNEVETTDFFLQRLSRARAPFFATYYSYAPHYDYFDHGPEYRILSDLEDDQNRYYNNLRLLDTQIGRMLDALRSSGRLADTIVLLVGDHGEGFGQHAGNFTHSRRSYDENLRVPAVLYQPALFAPREVHDFTTHADLLVTLLDAMGIEHDRDSMQGQSLLRGAPQRPYIYAFGNEGTLTSIDTQLERKLSISLVNDRCRQFDLAHDPLEQDAHDCDEHTQEQLETALRYATFQRKALREYNDMLVQRASAHASSARARVH